MNQSKDLNSSSKRKSSIQMRRMLIPCCLYSTLQKLTMTRLPEAKACFLSDSTENAPRPAELIQVLNLVSLYALMVFLEFVCPCSMIIIIIVVYHLQKISWVVPVENF